VSAPDSVTEARVLAAAWPAIPRPHQDRVVSEAGEMLAVLHGLDPEP
jgi:hygromycin-B 7''-O-kinase